MFFHEGFMTNALQRRLSVMSDEELFGKLIKGIEKSRDSIEKGVKRSWDTAKQFGNKVKDVEPVEAFEKGAKKGWSRVKELGKDVKSSVTKKQDEEK